jgi:BirA family biotin operon repressor/biotin-[acetyl-CoA-carboxylase] ligase
MPPRLPEGWRLEYHDRVGSTNDVAKDLARGGAAEGTLVWALEQTGGRGRRGRVWASPPGNLYSSLILRPACPPEEAAQLGFIAALAIGDALAGIAPAGAAVALKWPNDVLLEGRKVAGILLESEIGAERKPAFIVVGAGVNLVSSPSETEFPATFLLAESGVRVAPEIMLEAYAGAFAVWLRIWREEGFAPVRAAWRARAIAIGEPIRVRLDSATLCGRFADIDPQGALILEIGGERRRIPAGEVFPVHP